MNSLSLVIYLADVIPSLSILVGGILIIITILYGIGLFIGLAQYDVSDDTTIWKRVISTLKYMAPVCILLTLAFVLIPSRQTILLIAGSEFGEEVVTTPEAKELLEGIRQVIKSQLEQYTKKE